MSTELTRRRFLHTATAGGTLLRLSPLLALSPATALEAEVTPELVRLSANIEPIVRLIEQTPRDKCVEVMVEQLRKGLPYRQFLAALFLAGLRNFKPATVGPMHQVYMMHSAHELSLDARPEERLLPLFFALDQFKKATEFGAREKEPLHPFRGELPPADQALDEFKAGMEDWDGERADRAVVALVRSRDPAEIGEALWYYGARDIRQVGHKAIFVSNAWRTLETIGWQHAEPVLRALALSLVSYRMKYAQPKAEYIAKLEKQPYLRNAERVRKVSARLPGDWAEAHSDPGPTLELLALLRDGKTDDACQLAVSQLVEGTGRAGSVWDAVHLAAGELMMRQPNSVDAVHAVTSANALHHAFRMSGRVHTRLLVLLQAVGWMGEFRNMIGPGQDVRISQLMPGELPASEEAAARDVLAAEPYRGTFHTNDTWTTGEAAGKAFRYAQLYPEPAVFLREARRLIFLKSRDEHHYKYPAAIFEDYRLVDPRWRPHMLAASVYYLRGSGLPDSPVIQRAREAIGGK